MGIYSTRNKIKIITIGLLKDTSLELSKASLLTPFYGIKHFGEILTGSSPAGALNTGEV